jgi:hypothetical protein
LRIVDKRLGCFSRWKLQKCNKGLSRGAARAKIPSLQHGRRFENSRTLTTAALCLDLLAAATPAAANIAYICCGDASGVLDNAILNEATGTITTDGKTGVLQPGDILGSEHHHYVSYDSSFRSASDTLCR